MEFINAKLVHTENHFKSSITVLYTDILKKQCALKWKVSIHKLSLATYSLSKFGYIMDEGPAGFTPIKTREIIYLKKIQSS